MSPNPDTTPERAHAQEAHRPGLASKLNWLRAGVLGANDGIVSTAGLVVGVAGATNDRGAIFVAGLAGLVAGALSMAGGEYVSVSTQSDTERAAIRLEKWELENLPEDELVELRDLYVRKGLSLALADEVARELTAHDALAAHAEAELGIDPTEHANPYHAALSSMVAFTAGAVLPLVAILLPPPSSRLLVTVLSVAVALVITGLLSARLGGAPSGPAVARNVLVGLLAMAITFGIGTLFGGVT